MKIGDRVVRGPDWHWGDQDGQGPGTIIRSVDVNAWTVDWDKYDDRHFYYAVPGNMEITLLDDIGVQIDDVYSDIFAELRK